MTTKHFLLAGLGLSLLSGCGSNTDSGTATADNGGSGKNGSGGKTLTIAVIPKGSTHEYWKGVKAGAEEAAAEYKGGVTIKWQGPEKESDKDSQISVVENAITNHVDGMVLAPLDNQALSVPVQNVVNAKIPVVIIDSGVDKVDVLSYIATDNYKGGGMAATELAKELGDKGNIAMLRYEIGSASTDAREQGFLDEIKKHPGIKVVSDNQYAHATADTAHTASESLLSSLKKPDGSLSIDGMYCPNESSTFGTLRTLEENKWAGKIKFIGFDSSEKLIDGLKAGEINGLIVQNPHKMGYLGVKSIVDFIKTGKKPEAKIDTGATLVTKDNMATPDVAALIAPPKE